MMEPINLAVRIVGARGIDGGFYAFATERAGSADRLDRAETAYLHAYPDRPANMGYGFGHTIENAAYTAITAYKLKLELRA